MWKVVDYFEQNPNATALQAVGFFEEEFEIPKQVKALKDEARIISDARMELRPLYGKKSEVNEKIQYALSDIEVEVQIEFPPRKGSKEQRDAYRDKLKKENQDYNELNKRFKELNIQIDELNDKIDEADRAAKNARRLTELFNGYVQFIMEYRNMPLPIASSGNVSAPENNNSIF